MQRIKLDNGKYAYRFFNEKDLEAISKGAFIVIDDEKRTIEIGSVEREWDKDEDYFTHVVDVNLSKI